MKKALKFLPIVSALLLTSVSYTSHASIILDATNNNTLTSAQDLNGSFSSSAVITGFQPITSGLDWVSISALANADVNDGNGFDDYFSFTVDAGAIAYFDFENIAGPESELFNAIGSSIAVEANGWRTATGFTILPGDGDSNFLSYNFASAGTYTFGMVGTCTFGCFSSSSGNSYTLNIAVTGLTPSIPEPSILGIFALALCGLGYRKYKSSK